jgi:hypothetical protein
MRRSHAKGDGRSSMSPLTSSVESFANAGARSVGSVANAGARVIVGAAKRGRMSPYHGMAPSADVEPEPSTLTNQQMRDLRQIFD